MSSQETPEAPTKISVDGLLDHTKRLYEAQKTAVKIPNQGEAIYQRGYFKALFDVMAFIEAYVEAQKQAPKVVATDAPTCMHEWARRRDGRQCANCNAREFGSF